MPEDFSEKRSGHTQSVSRALSLLSKLAETPEGLNLSELARRVSLAPSTAHRLLTTLQLDQFVRFEDGRWLIGVQSFNVGQAYLRARDLSHMARPYLRMLMQECGETTNLALMEGAELVYVAQVECPELMRALARPGATAPWSCSAVGKSVLAFMPADEAEKIVSAIDFKPYTGRSHMNAASLMRDLARVRQQGYACDDEEFADGLRCIGAPIMAKNNQIVGAVSISGPTVRIAEAKLAQFGRVTMRTARELSRALGAA